MDTKRKGLIAALVLGLLSGPAIALGATGWLGTGGTAGAASAAPVAAVASVAIAAEDPAPTTTTADADLLAACTIDGPGLVDAEAAGTITDIEQAALDALRDICDGAGMALDTADQATDEAVVVRTVTVSATAAKNGSDDNGHYEEEHEDDDWDEDEASVEHQEEEEYEGGEDDEYEGGA